MKTIYKFQISALIALLAAALPAAAQTATPSTSLCAAATANQVTVCLTSSTNVVNQTGLYVDNEYMTVNLANGQTLPATNAQVPVTRANRAGNGPPSIHNSGALVWVALTSGLSINPGVNGFVYSTQIGDVGPCVRANITYLPHIWPDRSVIRDCNYGGYWVDYNPNSSAQPSGNPFATLFGTGTVALGTQSGTYVITKTSAWTGTLAAPTSGTADGTVIHLTSGTAFAHTLTATGLLGTGSAAVNLATFAAFPGAGLTLIAYQGKWLVLYSTGVTFT